MKQTKDIEQLGKSGPVHIHYFNVSETYKLSFYPPATKTRGAEAMTLTGKDLNILLMEALLECMRVENEKEET